MIFAYSFAESINLLLNRKRTVAVLFALGVGLHFISDVLGIDNPSHKFWLVHVISLPVSIYYVLVIDYGLRRSIALDEQDELPLRKYVETGRKFLWRLIGLGLIIFAVSIPFAIIPFIFLKVFASLESDTSVRIAMYISCIFIMRLWIFGSAFLVCRNRTVGDAYDSVSRISYGSAKHIFYLFVGMQTLNIFSYLSGTSKEIYFSYSLMSIVWLANLLLSVEAIRVIKAKGLDKAGIIQEREQVATVSSMEIIEKG